jgi:hypothetical protein
MWSAREEQRGLSKERLLELARLYARCVVTIDGFWFLAVEDLHDTGKALQLDIRAWEQYGKTEGRLLKRFLSVDSVTSLEELGRLLLLTPLFADAGAEAEIRDDKCYISVRACRPQKARMRKGLGEFPCKGVGLAYLQGLVPQLHKDIRFQCTLCPPDEHPHDLWCQWALWFADYIK